MSHPLHFSTAFFHLAQPFSRSSSESLGVNVALPLVLTLLNVSGREMSHPAKPMADPASKAEPSAVDLLQTREQGRDVRSPIIWVALYKGGWELTLAFQVSRHRTRRCPLGSA